MVESVADRHEMTHARFEINPTMRSSRDATRQAEHRFGKPGGAFGGELSSVSVGINGRRQSCLSVG